jgi:hypothetical protein
MVARTRHNGPRALLTGWNNTEVGAIHRARIAPLSIAQQLVCVLTHASAKLDPGRIATSFGELPSLSGNLSPGRRLFAVLVLILIIHGDHGGPPVTGDTILKLLADLSTWRRLCRHHNAESCQVYCYQGDGGTPRDESAHGSSSSHSRPGASQRGPRRCP